MAEQYDIHGSQATEAEQHTEPRDNDAVVVVERHDDVDPFGQTAATGEGDERAALDEIDGGAETHESAEPVGAAGAASGLAEQPPLGDNDPAVVVERHDDVDPFGQTAATGEGDEQTGLDEDDDERADLDEIDGGAETHQTAESVGAAGAASGLAEQPPLGDNDPAVVVERHDDVDPFGQAAASGEGDEQTGLDEDDDERAAIDEIDGGAEIHEDTMGTPDGLDSPGQASGAAELTGNQRWRELLADFVDDPGGAVRTATELVEGDFSAFVALLDQRPVDALPGDRGTQGGQLDNRTEGLRLALLACRDFSRQLAASVQSLG